MLINLQITLVRAKKRLRGTVAAHDFKRILICTHPFKKNCAPSNGERYPLVGGTRQRYFDETNFKPRKVLENAQTPTSRVHAVLAR